VGARRTELRRTRKKHFRSGASVPYAANALSSALCTKSGFSRARALAAVAVALVLVTFAAPARADEPSRQVTEPARAAVATSARPVSQSPVRVLVADARGTARHADRAERARDFSPAGEWVPRLNVAGEGRSPSGEDLRAVIAEASPATSTPEVRVDGALFAGLATAGLVVAERPGSDVPAPRPVAGLSPRLLRGGGVACDVRVSF